MAPKCIENQAEDDMGEWLSQFDWTYMVHWTFETPTSPKAASGIIRKQVRRLNPSLAFWKLEEGKVGGREHIHGLLKFKEGRSMSSRKIKRTWSRKYGIAKVDKYENDGGGAHYIGEYLRGPVDEYDIYRSGPDR